jgi:alpha-amylase
MRKSVNLIFAVHQPFRLRRYRFFDIGNDHYYYDDYANQSITEGLARKSYLPASSMLLRLLTRHRGNFKVSMFVSGTAVELFRKYTPSVIEAFKKLADTGNVEFLGGTWSNSPAALLSEEAFNDQVNRHRQLMETSFGQSPVSFFSPEMLYSDDIGEMIRQSGFRSVVIEGSTQVLGWRNANMLYGNAVSPGFKLLVTNRELGNDLAFRFAGDDWAGIRARPEEFMERFGSEGSEEQVVNVYSDMELMGVHQTAESGIFSFMESLISGIANHNYLKFSTPSETIQQYPPASILSVPNPVSRYTADGESTLPGGNELQREAMAKIFGMSGQFTSVKESDVYEDWCRLQSSDHFLYMLSAYYEKDIPQRPNPFNTPHEAFINFMNIISDLKLRAGSS